MTAAVAALGATGDVVSSRTISQPHLFHVVVAANHPKRTAILARINRGMEIIRLNGVWFDFVQEHLIRSAAPRYSKSEAASAAKSG